MHVCTHPLQTLTWDFSKGNLREVTCDIWQEIFLRITNFIYQLFCHRAKRQEASCVRWFGYNKTSIRRTFYYGKTDVMPKGLKTLNTLLIQKIYKHPNNRQYMAMVRGDKNISTSKTYTKSFKGYRTHTQFSKLLKSQMTSCIMVNKEK